MPSPKFQKYVIGPGTPLILVLVNPTGVPGHTVVSLAVNATVGAGCTVITLEKVLVTVPLVAVSTTVYVPTDK